MMPSPSKDPRNDPHIHLFKLSVFPIIFQLVLYYFSKNVVANNVFYGLNMAIFFITFWMNNVWIQLSKVDPDKTIDDGTGGQIYLINSNMKDLKFTRGVVAIVILIYSFMWCNFNQVV
jgi:hypothetical protein